MITNQLLYHLTIRAKLGGSKRVTFWYSQVSLQDSPDMVPPPRIELGTDAYKATVIPVNYKGNIGSSGSIRTNNHRVNSSMLYHWATEE